MHTAWHMLLQFVAITRRLKKIDHLRKSVLGSVGSFNAGRIESGRRFGTLVHRVVHLSDSHDATSSSFPSSPLPLLSLPLCNGGFITPGKFGN